MRTSFLPAVAVVFFFGLSYAVLKPDPRTLPYEAGKREISREALQELLVQRILLGEGGDALDDAYGNALLKVAENHFLPPLAPDTPGKKQEELLKEPRGFFPMARLGEENWAEQLRKKGFEREAYYHYWMLEQAYRIKDDSRFFAIQKKRQLCEKSLQLCAKTEKSALSPFVFFLKTEGGLVEIDPADYGLKRENQEGLLAGLTALKQKRWGRAHDLFESLRSKVKRGSAAYYELTWQLYKLEREIGFSEHAGLLELIRHITKVKPDLVCAHLNEELLSVSVSRDFIQQEPNLVEFQFFGKREGNWRGRALTTHSLSPVTKGEAHSPLPKRSKYPFQKATQKKQRELLEYLERQCSKPSNNKISLWRELGNQYIRLGDFANAQRIFAQLESKTQNPNDAFKRLASQFRQSFKRKMWKECHAFLENFRVDYPKAKIPELSFLEGQLALREQNWVKARALFQPLKELQDHPAKIFADFYCAQLDRVLIRVTVPNSLCENGLLKLRITRRNVPKMTFRFSKITEELTLSDARSSTKEQVADFFAKQMKKPQSWTSEQVISFPTRYSQVQKTELSLPLPGEGNWIVEARAGPLKTRFFALYHRVEVTSLQFPKSSLLIFQDAQNQPIPRLSVYRFGGRFLGKTDHEGALLTPLKDDSWRLDLRAKAEAKRGRAAVLYGSKPGLFIQCRIALGEKTRASALSQDRLFIYTDRPLYQAGETLHFKGFLRREVITLKRRPKRRYSVKAGQTVTIFISDKEKLLYKKELRVNEFGSFHGSYQFSKHATRKKYWVRAEYGESSQRAEVEVGDIQQNPWAIRFEEVKGGFRIFAGYTWGLPIPRATVECFVDNQFISLVLKRGFAFLPLKAGEKVTIALKQDGQTLLLKSKQFRALLNRVEPTPKSKEPPAPKTKKRRKALPRPLKTGPNTLSESLEKPFQLSLHKAYDPKKKQVILKLEAKTLKPWSAWLALGDQSAYDFRQVRSEGPAKLVTVTVSRACDPALYAHAHFEQGELGGEESLRIPVRAALLKLSLTTNKRRYEPRESVQFQLGVKDLEGRGRRAELSFAAVDEMIFSLKDDVTPDIYDFFYKDRGTDFHFERAGPFTLQGQDRLLEQSFEWAQYQAVNVKQRVYPLYQSVADAYGKNGGAYLRPQLIDLRGTLANEGGAEGVEDASVLARRWLLSHQSSSGLWDNTLFFKQCPVNSPCSNTGAPELSVFTTSLSMLALSYWGRILKFGIQKHQVKGGFKALLKLQRKNGSIGINGHSFSLLNHCSATIFLSKWAQFSKERSFEQKAQAAIDFLLSQKLKNSAWGWNEKSESANVLMTTWAVLALKAGQEAGLTVPEQALRDALAFLDTVTDSRGWTWFEKLGERAPGFFGNPRSVASPQWTAMALTTRLVLGQSRGDPVCYRGVQILRENAPKGPLTGKNTNFLYFFFASKVMLAVSGFEKPEWRKALGELVKAQESFGCAEGSWSLQGPWTALYGRPGAVALSLASLDLLRDYEHNDNQPFFEPPVIRFHFPKTASWKPRLLSNGAGVAEGQFTLPDSMTSFRLTSFGMSRETDVGQVTRWIQVRKDFFIRLHGPSFLYKGDRSELRAQVFFGPNFAPHKEVQLKLSGEGFQCLGESSKRLPGSLNSDAQSASWMIQASANKELQILVEARCGQASDAVSIKIPARFYGESRRELGEKLVSKAGDFDWIVPESAISGSQKGRLVLSPRDSVYFDIFETLDYLVDYPYGCVEQTMSRFLPALEVIEIGQKINSPVRAARRYKDVAKSGVKRLLDFQNPDGSWGWFRDDDPNPFMSAYVVYGLSRARKLGVEVDDFVISQGCVYLKSIVEKQTNNDLKAFLYFALQSAGEAKPKEWTALLGEPLSSYAKALLTLTFIRSGDRASAEKLLARLEKDRIDSGALSHFSTPTWFYKWEDVSIETSAFAFMAFLEVKPDHELIPRIKNWLLSQRQGKRWRTTKDSAAALFALIQYLAAEKAKRQKSKKTTLFQRRFTVTLNESPGRTLLLDMSKPMESQFQCNFDSSELKPGKNRVRLEGDFDEALGPLVFKSDCAYVASKHKLAAISKGLSIKRHWSKAPQQWKVGDLVTVTLELEAQRDYQYLMVRAPIPAGAFVRKKSAKGVFAEFEARHGEGLFFLTELKEGPHQLRFQFECQLAGQFRLSPAHVELMYNPAIYGRSAGLRSRIESN